MKRCLACRRDYYDDSLQYCLDDGNALLDGPASGSGWRDEPLTAVMPELGGYENATTIVQKSDVSRAGRNSIAVLPFTNISPDSENEYFCDGLSEELLNALTKIDDLKVAARTSAFSFKGKGVALSEIADKLAVNSILEGSVRRSGDRLRISVQLVNAADGYHIWSERYDREMADIFEVQDEITLAVVDALKLKLLGREKASILKRYTDNAEAYELFLQGRYCFNKYTPDDLLKGIEYFERAIAIEPEYAPAYANIGFCYGALFYFGHLAPYEVIDKWRIVINRALEIDETLTDAYLSHASIHYYYDWNAVEAERDYLRALDLNPISPDAHWRYGHFLAYRERFDEAVAEGRKALELDPLSLVVKFFMVRIYSMASRLDEALEQLHSMIAMEPNYSGSYILLGGVYTQRGLIRDALEAYEKARSLGTFSGAVLSFLGTSYGLLGEREKAAAILEQLLEMRKSQYVTPYNIARIYSGLGDNDKAFEWLEKGIEERNGEMVALKCETSAGLFGGTVRDDVRLPDLMLRVGLAEGAF